MPEIPLFVEPATFTATNLRRLLDALISVGGIIHPTDLAVTQRAAGANMSVDVASGQTTVHGTTLTNQGTYLLTSNASINCVVATAPTSGTRTDVVVAQVYDNEADSSGQQAWTPLVVTNPTNNTGTIPTLPASSIPLASLTVAANVSSIVTANIADLRQQAVPVGTPYIQRGHFSMSFVSGIATGTVTFPAAFNGTPYLQLTCQAITNNTTTVLNQTGVTSTGFTYRAALASGSTAYTGAGFADWVAVY
jgi:hypothetical protein